MNTKQADEGFKGSYVEKKTGEVYALKIVIPVDPELGHSHELKNERHFWCGNEKQFKEQFQKL